MHARGPVLTIADADYDNECRGFNLSGVPRPDLVVGAATAADMVSAIRYARDRGLPVGLQATGHGPGRPMTEGLLINTRRLSGVRIDPDRATARIAAGATWEKVVAAAAPYGLAPLCGAAPGVGAVSYTLGGGLGPLGRRYGFAADHVDRIDIVTADGEARVATFDRHPDLFWALRGGGGNFGAVTEIEVKLFPVAHLYGGSLTFAARHAARALSAFQECASVAPRELSLSAALVHFPDLPTVPAPLRAQFCVQVRVAHLGHPTAAESLIAPVRACGAPILDTVRVMPFADVGTIHNDPVAPRPVTSDATTLTGLPDGVLDSVLAAAEPSTPFMIELRHLGGALHDVPDGGNAVGHRAAAINVFTSAYPGTDAAAAAHDQRAFIAGLGRWSAGGPLLNFQSATDHSPSDAAAAYERGILTRLSAVKAEWDPADMFRFTHNLPV